MKKILQLIALLCIANQVSATSLFGQLCTFNFNWNNYPMQVNADELAVPVSEQEYVQLHLSHVLPILKSNPRKELSPQQHKTRQYLIGILQQYCNAGKFPLNEETDHRIPVFIDKYGTYCAVGYLMRASGYNDLALRISAADNLAWVKDIQTEGVAEWQQFSGFTMDELKLIQGAYDSYHPMALFLPNKYEVPQKPEVAVHYFDDEPERKDIATAQVWCKGEGSDGVLHGKWVQNYSHEFPWIEGYYAHGKRTGQWKEYYPGTNLLCRTENWRDDKLNGIRKRFDRDGRLIEEIMFRDGVAVVKTNYDFVDSIYQVRKPLDSTHVSTEVYSFEGRLLAMGNETVVNPGNLKWFQNIELTMLNSLMTPSAQPTFSQSPYLVADEYSHFTRSVRFADPFGPALVTYEKLGVWRYFPEGAIRYNTKGTRLLSAEIENGFMHYAKELIVRKEVFESARTMDVLDSIVVYYNDDDILKLSVYGVEQIDFAFTYFTEPNHALSVSHPLTAYFGMNDEHHAALESGCCFNENGQRVGTWWYFNRAGDPIRKEIYLVPEDNTPAGEVSGGLPLGDAWKRE